MELGIGLKNDGNSKITFNLTNEFGLFTVNPSHQIGMTSHNPGLNPGVFLNMLIQISEDISDESFSSF